MAELAFHRSASARDAAQEAAHHIARHARQRLAHTDVFTLALSGGSTPRLMLHALAQMALPWRGIHIFQVDERIAPPGDSARNLNMLSETLVASGVLDVANLHPMPVNARDLGGAVAEYTQQLAAYTGSGLILDLVHLGLGDDGHTASLVPGDPVLQVENAAVAITNDYRGHRRMTLTYPTLNSARACLWLASGADKAPMLARLARADHSIPAGRVTCADCAVFTDIQAAT